MDIRKHWRKMVIFWSLLLIAWPATAGTTDIAWVITTDFGTYGEVRGLASANPVAVSDNLATIPGDAVGRHHGGLVYIVGRAGSSLVQIYDPAAGFTLVREFSLGGGRNPQDIAFDGEGDAYVSCYDQAVLLKVDVNAGEVVETFDTEQFADADGLPETGWMVMHDGLLFITCQKLDRRNWYAPTGPGALLVFDPLAEQWRDMDPDQAGVQPIQLTGSNPYTRLVVVQGSGLDSCLRLSCAGSFGLLDGGLELIDPAAGTSLGLEITEQELGGDVIAFVGAGNVVYALVSDPAFVTSLRRVDLTTGDVDVLATGAGYVFVDLALGQAGQILLADRTLGASGVRAFDQSTGLELTSGAVFTGLPPQMFILPGGLAAVPEPAEVVPASVVQLAPFFPNPCNPAAETLLTGPPLATVTLTVSDLRGRQVQRKTVRTDAQGQAVFRFTGVGRDGSALPAGMYVVTVRGAGGSATRSLSLVK